MDIQLSPRQIKTASVNYEKSAALGELLYVSDREQGIQRKKKGKGFIYFYEDKQVKDDKDLERIQKLVIPPAWESVWICKSALGHLQATGYDSKKRKQYKYHSLWASLRSQTKFYRLFEFGNALSVIREQIRKDLSLPQMTEKKVLALILRLMDETGIRIGNEEYEKENGTYGLTTLKDNHVSIKNGNTIHFVFEGKGSIKHKITLHSKRLARIVKQCRDIPGKELFQYYDENGEIKKVDSGMVNRYIKETAGENFTAKDFRTWVGSVNALGKLVELEQSELNTSMQKLFAEVITHVAKQLGNTKAVCKKYYIHPILFEWYECGNLKKLNLNEVISSTNHVHLSNEEKRMMIVLEKALHHKIVISQN